MSGGTDTSSQSQQSNVNQVQLPPWVNQGAQQNYALAQQVAQRPLVQYQGQMVADASPQTQQAWNLAATSGQAGQPQYQESEAGLLNAMGQGPLTATPGALATSNLSPYLNQFTNQVINTALPIYQQQLGQQQSQIGGQAVQNNAFGGSRMGVQQGVAQAQGAQGMANMAAQLQQANLTNAQSQAQQDLNRNLTAQQGNQTAAQNAINSQIQAASQLGQLGNAQQANQARQFSELTTAGGLEQAQAQNQINAQMQKFGQAWSYPQQQLNTLLTSLGMTPYGQTQLGFNQGQQETQYSSNPMMAALGGLTSLGSMFSAPAGGTSAMQGLMNMFGSDPRMKKNVTPLGPDPATGVPLHAFHYKGAPSGALKTIGAMSPDVEQAFPGSTVVHPATGMRLLNPARTPPSLMPRPPVPMAMGMGGRLGVHMPMLDAMAAPRPVGPTPGALSPPVPIGTVGALGAAMQAPRVRPRRPMIPGGGALAIGA